MILIESQFINNIVNDGEPQNFILIESNFIGGGGGGGGTWGSIVGTLSNQTDLQSALDAKVPYTGATATLDMGAYDVNARGIKVNGTAGLGHVDMKHQSGTPTGSASSSTLYADTNGDIAWLNDHSHTITLIANANTANRSYTLPNATGTIALTSDVSGLARSAISESATGLDYNSSTGVFTISSGYGIPTTASQTNWDTAYTWVSNFPTQTGQSGKFLTTNGTSLSWGTVSSALSGLSDVTLTTPLNSQVLTYNGTKWVNQAPLANSAVNLFAYYNFV